MNAQSLIHHWVHQTLGQLRAGNLWFSGNVISHYSTWMGYIHADPKSRTKIYFLNDERYSNSTTKVQSYVRRSIPGHCTTILLPGGSRGRGFDSLTVEDVKKHLLSEMRGCIKAADRAKEWKSLHYESLSRLARSWDNVFGKGRKLMPDNLRAKKKIPLPKEIQKVLDYLASDQYQEDIRKWNEAKAEKDRTEDQRRTEAQLRRGEKMAQAVQDWKGGKIAGIGGHSQIFLRRVVTPDKDIIETSWKAEVPTSHALRLYRIYLKWEKMEDITLHSEKIGLYSVSEVNEQTITIGCHKIPMSEVKRVLDPLLGEPVARLLLPVDQLTDEVMDREFGDL